MVLLERLSPELKEDAAGTREKKRRGGKKRERTLPNLAGLLPKQAIY